MAEKKKWNKNERFVFWHNVTSYIEFLHLINCAKKTKKNFLSKFGAEQWFFYVIQIAKMDIGNILVMWWAIY